MTPGTLANIAERGHARRPTRRLLLALSIILVAAPAAYLMAEAAAERLLVVRHAPVSADAIVVLGGDGPPRAARAAELWLAGFAPRIIVAGSGDCRFIRSAMIHEGVDPEAISIECLSRNTWENALNSAPLLNDLGPRKSFIVTSWFHSARALRAFETICPGIEWISMPAERRASFSAREVWAVTIEYPKTLVYYLREALFRPQSAADLPCRVAAGGRGA